MIPFLHTWYWFIWVGVAADFLFWYLSLYICPTLTGKFCTNLCGVLEGTHRDSRYYFSLILAVGTCLLPQHIIWFVKVMRAPSAPCIIRERIAKGVFDIVVAPRGGQKMVVVVPKKGSNEWRGFAFAEQDDTRWGHHRRSMRLDEQPSAAAIAAAAAAASSKHRFANSLRSRTSRSNKNNSHHRPEAAAAAAAVPVPPLASPPSSLVAAVVVPSSPPLEKEEEGRHSLLLSRGCGSRRSYSYCSRSSSRHSVGGGKKAGVSHLTIS